MLQVLVFSDVVNVMAAWIITVVLTVVLSKHEIAPWWWFLREPKHVEATVGILIVLIFVWYLCASSWKNKKVLWYYWCTVQTWRLRMKVSSCNRAFLKTRNDLADQNFSSIYGTQRFIALFKNVCKMFISASARIHSIFPQYDQYSVLQKPKVYYSIYGSQQLPREPDPRHSVPFILEVFFYILSHLHLNEQM
jgi:hypothetical protein